LADFSCAIGVCLYGFYRAFDGESFEEKINMLLFSEAGIYAKYKNLLNIFIMLNTVRNSTIMYFLFVLSMKENHPKKTIGFVSIAFVELYTTHLLKEEPRFYHLSV